MCKACGPYQIKQDDFHCEECGDGRRADNESRICLDIPEEYIDYRNPWAIGAMVVSSVGKILQIMSI